MDKKIEPRKAELEEREKKEELNEQNINFQKEEPELYTVFPNKNIINNNFTTIELLDKKIYRSFSQIDEEIIKQQRDIDDQARNVLHSFHLVNKMADDYKKLSVEMTEMKKEMAEMQNKLKNDTK